MNKTLRRIIFGIYVLLFLWTLFLVFGMQHVLNVTHAKNFPLENSGFFIISVIAEVSGVWDGRSLQSLFNKVWNLWGLSMNASLFAVAILNFVHFEMGLPMGKKHRRCTKFHGPRSSGRMFCPKPSAMMCMIGAESWKNSECHPGFTLGPRQQTRRSLAKKTALLYLGCVRCA